jgi:glycosyltransferase involved in cell wall biosynthesis
MTGESTTPRSMRIVMVYPQFTPMIGGTERAGDRLARALAARGHRVTVISERRDRRWPRREQRDGFVVERVPCIPRRRVHRISAQIALGCHLARRLADCDVVHLSPPGAASEVVLGLARLWRRPAVIRPGGTGPRGMGTATEGWRGRLGRALERRVDACIALTPLMATEARRFGVSAERIHVIPNGIDTVRWNPVDGLERERLRREHGIAPSEVVVLYVGRLSREKNAGGLLEAWGRLAAPAGRARLVLVGDGPGRSELEAMIDAHRWRGVVSITGFVDDPLPWYRIGDVLALASRHEGFPNCVLEAMSCGLPVVAVRTAVPDELAVGGAAGELVATWDVAAFAAGLERLIDDRRYRERCGSRARQLVSQHYEMDDVAARVEALYRSILERRRSDARDRSAA